MLKCDQEIINFYRLSRHPEGGWYRRTFESSKSLCLPQGTRLCGTSIYYYLAEGERSALHYLSSDETWYFHFGSSIRLHLFSSSGYRSVQLGLNWQDGEQLQYSIEGGIVFGAELMEPRGAMLSCSVCPGFEQEDFYWPKKNELFVQYPEQKAIIERLFNN